MGGRDLTSDLIWDLGSGIGSDRVSTFIAERLYYDDVVQVDRNLIKILPRISVTGISVVSICLSVCLSGVVVHDVCVRRFWPFKLI